MPYAVRNKKTGLFAKVRKKGWPRSIEWVENVNEATTYRNEGAALISCGKHVASNKRQQIREEIATHSKLMNDLYGPASWPKEERTKSLKLCRQYDRTPFGHMQFPEDREVVYINFVVI